MALITLTPDRDSRENLTAQDLVPLLNGVTHLFFDTPGGRIPRVIKAVKNGNTLVVTLTN